MKFSSSLPILKNTAQQIEPDIVFKETDLYELIWKDSGSGADMDGSIWRAEDYDRKFCSLGDSATGNHGKPTHFAVLVHQRKHGALMHPTSFTKIWNDGGSGAHSDVTVYKMNAHNGYTCIGHVAVNSFTSQPNAKKYCCVKNSYLAQAADALSTWNDRGSGAHADVSFWSTIRSTDPFALNSGNFIATIGYNKPITSSFKLLKNDGIKVRDVWTYSSGGNEKPVSLYQIYSLKKVWDDAGSGANADCSIWRAERGGASGIYPVGDIVVATHSKPNVGFVMTSKHDTAFRSPVGYDSIWNDAGSGAHRDVTLWKARCPSGYVDLGYVATNGPKPEVGDIYCISSKFATIGNIRNWKYTWRDHGSGAHRDVSIFEAKSLNNNEQTVRGFGAIASHGGHPRPVWILRKDSINFIYEKPITKVKLSHISYSFDTEEIESGPEKLGTTTAINNSDLIQEKTISIGYSYTTAKSFEFTNTLEIGIAVEYNVGVPVFGGAKTTVSATNSFSITNGSQESEEKNDKMDVKVIVPAKSKMTAVVVGRRYKADIPFTAHVKKYYYDGSIGHGIHSGVFKGTDVTSFEVEWGETEYFCTFVDNPKFEQYCPFWKSYGYCEKQYKEWMSQNCKKTCECS